MGANQDLSVVVTVDIVGSQKVKGLREKRDEVLAGLSTRHLHERRVLSQYTVTAWDEFQNVLARPSDLPDVVWDLRLAFRPEIELKIGAGFGEIDSLPGPDTSINQETFGGAFLRAREAINHLVRNKEKFPLRTAVRSGDPVLDRTLNLIYMLLDGLLSNLSDRQWETIGAYADTGRQDAAAKRLGVSGSTISRNLQRGFYWQLEHARREIRKLLDETGTALGLM